MCKKCSMSKRASVADIECKIMLYKCVKMYKA